MGISRCAHLIQWFGDRKYDIFLQAVFRYIIVVMAVIAGGLLLCILLKMKEKRRTDMLVIILSMPDICVGFVFISVTSLPFFITEFEILCKLSPSLIFFFYLILFFCLSPDGNKKSHVSKECYNRCFVSSNSICFNEMHFICDIHDALGFSNRNQRRWDLWVILLVNMRKGWQWRLLWYRFAWIYLRCHNL